MVIGSIHVLSERTFTSNQEAAAVQKSDAASKNDADFKLASYYSVWHTNR